MKKFSLISGITLMYFLALGCNEFIEYSPYDTNVTSENINTNNAATIFGNEPGDTLKFALISDSHTDYDKLKDAIKSINQQEELQFVISCGDVTDLGLSQEFIWYRDIISKSRYPVITVIGNHDHRSNGLKIYEKMFGPANMSFTCSGYKFIMFDDVIWENNNIPPKFNWLKAELDKSNFPCVLLTHIPPWSDQLDGVYDLIFADLISESKLILCLHGHQHSFSKSTFAGVPAIVVEELGEGEYYIIKLYGLMHKIETVHF